jgi:hypothetical protein
MNVASDAWASLFSSVPAANCIFIFISSTGIHSFLYTDSSLFVTLSTCVSLHVPFVFVEWLRKGINDYAKSKSARDDETEGSLWKGLGCSLHQKTFVWFQISLQRIHQNVIHKLYGRDWQPLIKQHHCHQRWLQWHEVSKRMMTWDNVMWIQVQGRKRDNEDDAERMSNSPSKLRRPHESTLTNIEPLKTLKFIEEFFRSWFFGYLRLSFYGSSVSLMMRLHKVR